MGVGRRPSGVWYRPRCGELHRPPRERQDGPGLAWDGDHRQRDGFLSDAVVKAIKELERGGHVTGGPIQGRQKEQGK